MAEYPDLPPLCYDWNKVQWPPIPAGTRVRLDYGEFYTKTGVVMEDVGPYCKIDVGGELTELGKRWLAVIEIPRIDFAQTFDHGAEPALELACHRPSTIPPPVETNEIGAIVHSAEVATDHEPSDDGPRSYGTMHHAPTPPNIPEGAAMVTSSGLDKPLPHIGSRRKTEFTAKEWGDSMHFLAFMKKEPYKHWSVAHQNAKRDEFVASVPPDERMNRWGQRFAKFCGVST